MDAQTVVVLLVIAGFLLVGVWGIVKALGLDDDDK